MWFPCADPYASCMVSIWQLYGLAIWQPYAHHTAGIWLCHMPIIWMSYRSHMALPYVFCMASIWQAYGLVICLPCVINITAIWLNHIAAICIPHGRHMATECDFHVQVICDRWFYYMGYMQTLFIFMAFCSSWVNNEELQILCRDILQAAGPFYTKILAWTFNICPCLDMEYMRNFSLSTVLTSHASKTAKK